MNLTVITYAFYLLISVAFTMWVAQTLHKNGRIFLVNACHENYALADSINHLLKVGFYLINLGYVSLALKLASPVVDYQESIEALSQKIGTVLVVLGVMHFFNLYVIGNFPVAKLGRADNSDDLI
jgi:hypothetical protein